MSKRDRGKAIKIGQDTYEGTYRNRKIFIVIYTRYDKYRISSPDILTRKMGMG